VAIQWAAFLDKITANTHGSSIKTRNINEQIVAPEVRVIGPNGEQLGVMATAEALRLAKSFGMDLVELAPGAVPPVTRIVNFARFQMELKTKQRGPADYSGN